MKLLKKILKNIKSKTNVAKNEEKIDDMNREQKVKTDIAKKEQKKIMKIKIRMMNEKKLMIHNKWKSEKFKVSKRFINNIFIEINTMKT